MKIAIVGSGIAGLAAAIRLRQADQQVVIFEKQQAIGMDAHSLPIEHGNQTVRADVPSRMFNELEWPRLMGLYRELGVEFTAVDTTQSFSRLGGEAYLKLDVANRPWLAAKSIVNSRVRELVRNARRLQELGSESLSSGMDSEIAFGDYLSINGFEQQFIDEFLYPTLSSTVLTCSYQALRNYPAAIVLQSLKNLTDSPSLLRTRFGTQDVVQRLASKVDDIRLGTTVSKVESAEDAVEVHFDSQTETFDHLILATQANHAAKLVQNIKSLPALDLFRYEDVNVTVHTDSNLMPGDQRDWATFNMISSDNSQAAMCTVWLNRFHDNWDLGTPIFQTINPIAEVREAKVISRAALQRPVIEKTSFSTWESLDQYHRQSPKVWFIGSYAARGVPLLETGVISAEAIVDKILASEPAANIG